MKEYKFSFFKRPKLIDCYTDFIKNFENITVRIFGFDNGEYKIFEIQSSQFKNKAFFDFIKINNLKVKMFKVYKNDIVVDCY